jgi:hypothetical protein
LYPPSNLPKPPILNEENIVNVETIEVDITMDWDEDSLVWESEVIPGTRVPDRIVLCNAEGEVVSLPDESFEVWQMGEGTVVVTWQQGPLRRGEPLNLIKVEYQMESMND